MAVFRVIKDKDNPYVTINKYYIYDSRLSLKAKGLMSYFLSRPDNWNFYTEEIKKHTKDKDTSISSAIKELMDSGYIRREAKRGDKGKFTGGYNYSIYETPIVTANDESNACIGDSPKPENPNSVKSRTGETPNRENQGLLSNDLKLNNDSILSNDNTTTATKNKPVDNFIEFFNNNFGHLMTPFEFQILQSYVNDGMQPGVIMIALQEAVEADIRDMRYVKKILNRWLENKIFTIEAVMADKRNFESKRKKKEANKQQFVNKRGSTFNNFEQRSYDYDDLERKLLGWDKDPKYEESNGP